MKATLTRISRPVACTLAAAVLWAVPSNGSGDGMSVHTTDAAIEIHDAGDVIAVFHTGIADPAQHPARLQYMHPFVGTNGQVMTEDMPEDHLHQRGIYWAWRQIMLDGQQMANSWILEDILFAPVSRSAEVTEEGDARLVSELIWRVRHDKGWLPLVSEKATIVMKPERQGARDLSLLVTLEALRDGVMIGGAPNSRGYGGISVRFKDGPLMRFHRLDGGDVTPTVDAVTADGALAMTWDQGSDLAALKVTMACTVDGAPVQQWITRRQLSMQNCVWPGRTPVPLTPGAPVTLRATLSVEKMP